MNAGIRGLTYCYTITKHQATAELYIDRGKESQEENENIFDKLSSLKGDIEERFGDSLEWERLEGKRACRIKKALTEGGYLDEAKWTKLHEMMVSSMSRMENALSPHIKKLEF